MASAFIEAYCKLVIEDETFTLADVPKRHREKVKALLDERGYNEKGEKIVIGLD